MATSPVMAVHPADYIPAPIVLKAAGLVAANASAAAVTVGKGRFRVVYDVTAIEVATTDEHFLALIESNTQAAASTWHELATLFCLGAKEQTGRAAADEPALHGEFIIDNPYDSQIRLTTYVLGTIATGINFSVTLYPVLA